MKFVRHAPTQESCNESIVNDEVQTSDVTTENIIIDDIIAKIVESVQTPPIGSTEIQAAPDADLEDKYAIPSFEKDSDTTAEAKIESPVQRGLFTRVVPSAPTQVVQPTQTTHVETASATTSEVTSTPTPDLVEEKIPAESVSKIELIDEVPAGEKLVDGVELVGELNPEVEKQLNKLVESGDVVVEPTRQVRHRTEDLRTIRTPSIPDGFESDPTPQPEKKVAYKSITSVGESVGFNPIGKVEEKSVTPETGVPTEDAWDGFVENVIVPTLCTAVDNLKDFVRSTLVEELKKSRPE